MRGGVLSSVLHYWLVDHPSVRHFTWAPGHTFGSTPLFLTLTVLSYLVLTRLLVLLNAPPLPPAILKAVTAIHNLALSSLSLFMAAGCALSSLSQAPDPRWIVCFPAGKTPPRGPTFFWAY
ncbi:hypothetical protein CRG98_026570, partial [Punica granatum]